LECGKSFTEGEEYQLQQLVGLTEIDCLPLIVLAGTGDNSR
jgi:hypothetical protein